MAGLILRLGADEVLQALEKIDLAELVATDLVGRVAGDRAGSLTGRFVPEHDADELTAVEDVATGDICQLPTVTLRTIRSVALAGLAARELLAPGVVTAAVFGSGAALRLQVAVLAWYVPNLSHVAVYAGNAGYERPVEQSVRDQLELAGIGLSTTTDPRQAGFGANLLVIAGPGPDRFELGQLSPGVLVVNAADRDLPDDLVEGVDQIYVDDLTLLDDNQHRSFVKLHMAGPDARPEPLLQHIEGWHRHQSGWRERRRVEADLGRVLAGTHAGRTHIDDILLVELLNDKTLDVTLASRLQQAALKHGLGRWITSGEKE